MDIVILTKEQLNELSYEELEKETEKVIRTLSDSSIGLDTASRLYAYGNEILSAMTDRLDGLMKSVEDKVETE